MRRRIIKKNIRKKRYSSSGGGVFGDIRTIGRNIMHWGQLKIDGFNGAETTKPSPYPSVQNNIRLKK